MRLPPPLVKAICAVMSCMSSGCMGPVTRSLFSCRMGVGRDGTLLSHGPGHAVPGNARGLSCVKEG